MVMVMMMMMMMLMTMLMTMAMVLRQICVVAGTDGAAGDTDRRTGVMWTRGSRTGGSATGRADGAFRTDGRTVGDGPAAALARTTGVRGVGAANADGTTSAMIGGMAGVTVGGMTAAMIGGAMTGGMIDAGAMMLGATDAVTGGTTDGAGHYANQCRAVSLVHDEAPPRGLSVFRDPGGRRMYMSPVGETKVRVVAHRTAPDDERRRGICDVYWGDTRKGGVVRCSKTDQVICCGCTCTGHVRRDCPRGDHASPEWLRNVIREYNSGKAAVWSASRMATAAEINPALRSYSWGDETKQVDAALGTAGWRRSPHRSDDEDGAAKQRKELGDVDDLAAMFGKIGGSAKEAARAKELLARKAAALPGDIGKGAVDGKKGVKPLVTAHGGVQFLSPSMQIRFLDERVQAADLKTLPAKIDDMAKDPRRVRSDFRAMVKRVLSGTGRGLAAAAADLDDKASPYTNAISISYMALALATDGCQLAGD
eukprot:gene4883-6219_t